MFMISACLFVILFEHPLSPLKMEIGSSFLRRLFIGLAMGLTAIMLIYSGWGKKSGAHMNPAVTIAFWHLHRISGANAFWYILAQITGGTLAVLLIKSLVPILINAPEVNYVVTTPGMKGPWVAFAAEFLMAFILFFTILQISNSKLAAWTGVVAGILVFMFISFEAPYSGMSINPARTIASAIPAHLWSGWWIYFTAPVLGMFLAAHLFRTRFMKDHDGSCVGLKCHLTGKDTTSATYEILFPPKS
ncbi:MAG: aquaporin [Saprospiraceae bacterium]|uniref:Aquaporin n=1 Tax=Candidatus Opimibacter skivensis TaxID=2982028 RepID=A0A9D7XVJ7_9BACT|nr:aquaporin [Candidatus Opimibacter skivensis]